MLSSQASLADVLTIQAPASQASTVTGAWVDVRKHQGEILFIQACGALTGSLAGKIQDATDIGGTGAADVTGANFPAGVANAAQKLVLDSRATRGFIRYVGTIVTGPVVLGVTFAAAPTIV